MEWGMECTERPGRDSQAARAEVTQGGLGMRDVCYDKFRTSVFDGLASGQHIPSPSHFFCVVKTL